MHKSRIFGISAAALALVLISVLIYAGAAPNSIKLIPIINLPGVGGTSAEINVAYVDGMYTENEVFNVVLNAANTIELPRSGLEYSFSFAGGEYQTIAGMATLTYSGHEQYFPAFFGDATTGCLALYAETDSEIELSILPVISTNQLLITSEHGSESTFSRINGIKLKLFAGETAVVTGLDFGTSYTLNDVAGTLDTYTFLPVSGNYGGGTPPPPTSAGVDRKLLQIALDDAAKFAGKAEQYTEVSWTLFEELHQAAEVAYGDETATQAEIDSATEALIEAMMSLQGKPPEAEPYETLDFGDAKADFALRWERDSAEENSTAILDIISAEAAYLSAASFDLEIGEELEFEYAGGQNGFTLIRSAADENTISLVLVRLGDQNTAASNSFNTTDTDGLGSGAVVRLRFRIKSADGTAEVTMSNALAAAVDSNGYGADIAVNTPVAALPLNLTEASSVSDLAFDFNHDKIISMADLSTAANWYRASSSDAVLWQEAKDADIDGDGVITVVDFISILLEIEKYLG